MGLKYIVELGALMESFTSEDREREFLLGVKIFFPALIVGLVPSATSDYILSNQKHKSNLCSLQEL